MLRGSGARARARWAAAAVAVATASFGSAAHAHVAHTVEEGESLWSIAAANGMSPSQIAAANGLSRDAQLTEGATVQIPDQGSSTAGWESSSGSAGSETSGASGHSHGPYATQEGVTSDQVAQQGHEHGVSGSLASAVAWQESGFRNDVVSSADARGVMQILPGTWEFIQDSVAGRRLDPYSAAENVHAGVMYLDWLQRQTGDERTAVAGYYQGLGSVRENGPLPETEDYVDNVMSLRGRFGG